MKRKAITLICLILVFFAMSGCDIFQNGNLSPLPGESTFLSSVDDSGYGLTLHAKKRSPGTLVVLVQSKEEMSPAKVPKLLFDTSEYLLSDEVSKHIQNKDFPFAGLTKYSYISYSSEGVHFELSVWIEKEKDVYTGEKYRATLLLWTKEDRSDWEAIDLAFTEDGVLNRDLDKPFSVEQITLF